MTNKCQKERKKAFSPHPPLQAYIGKPLRDFNTEREGGEAAIKIIAELADNGSDFELILITTRKKWPSKYYFTRFPLKRKYSS